jgi:hypothetical protein
VKLLESIKHEWHRVAQWFPTARWQGHNNNSTTQEIAYNTLLPDFQVRISHSEAWIASRFQVAFSCSALLLKLTSCYVISHFTDINIPCVHSMAIVTRHYFSPARMSVHNARIMSQKIPNLVCIHCHYTGLLTQQTMLQDIHIQCMLSLVEVIFVCATQMWSTTGMRSAVQIPWGNIVCIVYVNSSHIQTYDQRSIVAFIRISHLSHCETYSVSPRHGMQHKHTKFSYSGLQSYIHAFNSTLHHEYTKEKVGNREGEKFSTLLQGQQKWDGWHGHCHTINIWGRTEPYQKKGSLHAYYGTARERRC